MADHPPLHLLRIDSTWDRPTLPRKLGRGNPPQEWSRYPTSIRPFRRGDDLGYDGLFLVDFGLRGNLRLTSQTSIYASRWFDLPLGPGHWLRRRHRRFYRNSSPKLGIYAFQRTHVRHRQRRLRVIVFLSVGAWIHPFLLP